MTLRKKTLILTGLTVGSLILILYAISRGVLLNNYEKLEEQSGRRNVARVADALNAELSNLDDIAGDWSVWDDTYAFVQGNHDTYIQSNLVDQVFENLRVNLTLFIDDAGQVVFGKAFDLQSGQEIPVPAEIYSYFSVGSALLTFSDTYSSRAGFILLDEGPMLASIRPIVTSEYQGPIKGTLIFGRYLNNDEVERLMKITHLNFTIDRLGNAQVPQEFAQMLATSQEENLIYFQPLSMEIMAGYTLIRDIFDKPAFFLNVELPRDIYQQGLNTISYFGYLLLFAGLAFGLVAIYLLEKIILSRVANLNESVRRYGVDGNLAGRLGVAGNDELSSLGNEINKMLEALEKSERALRESERRNAQKALDRSERLYRTLFECANDAIFLINLDDTYTAVNEKAANLLGYERGELVGKEISDIVTPSDYPDYIRVKQILVEVYCVLLYVSNFFY
jgi:sensor domain CHASE-containing protein